MVHIWLVLLYILCLVKILNYYMYRDHPITFLNKDVQFFSDSIMEYFHKFDCRKSTGALILPNALAINKNYNLDQHDLDEPFIAGMCTNHKAIFINLWGDLGNENELNEGNIQKTLCGCEIHKHLLTCPPLPPPPGGGDPLLILGRGVTTLNMPLLGMKPLVHKAKNMGMFYHLNEKGEIIVCNPCSQLPDGLYEIDDVLIQRRDILNLKTRRPDLFSESMQTRDKVRTVLCSSQQVYKLYT